MWVHIGMRSPARINRILGTLFLTDDSDVEAGGIRGFVSEPEA